MQYKLVPQLRGQRSARVCDLLDRESGQWDPQLLINLFGYQACMIIVDMVPVPSEEGQEDVLICNLSSNGRYKVKDAYKYLRNVNPNANLGTDSFWEWIWKKGDIAPCVCLFVWKLIRGAVPVGRILASRGIHADTTCAVCVQQEETINHMLFLCPFARLCLFSTSIGVTSHLLTDPIHELLNYFFRSITGDQWTDIANVFWAVWRCRNDATYGGNKPTLQTFKQYYASISSESTLNRAGGLMQKANSMVTIERGDGIGAGMGTGTDVGAAGTTVTCYLDGSWTSDWKRGVGLIIYTGDELTLFLIEGVLACCPLQTEVWL